MNSPKLVAEGEQHQQLIDLNAVKTQFAPDVVEHITLAERRRVHGGQVTNWEQIWTALCMPAAM
jgi:hypothetical protein